jgi:hypothetical protein
MDTRPSHLLSLLLVLGLAGCPGDGSRTRDTRWSFLERGVPSVELGVFDIHVPDHTGEPGGKLDTGQPTGDGAAYFQDVPASSSGFTEIQWVQSKGIMNGCQASPPLFCPTNATTRAELASALIRMKYGATFTYPATPYFTDVPSGHWAFSYIQRLASDGITSGCGTSLYCPDDNATRAHAAVFLVKMKYGDSFSYPLTPFFTDVPASHSAFKYIQKLRDANLTAGCNAGGTTYCPDDPLLRQQLAVLLYRAQTL